MFLTKEEIAKRRLNYESGKRMGPTVTIAPTEVLKYLDEIESRDIQIDELRNELFEVRRYSEQRIDGTLKSIDDTLKVLREFVIKKTG
jgi:hypothetical protein